MAPMRSIVLLLCQLALCYAQTTNDASPQAENTAITPVRREVSQRSCEDLGWVVEEKSPTVCASATVNGACAGYVGYSEAAAFCSDAGARLCTSEELTNDIGVGTGCRVDTERVWGSSVGDCESGQVLTQAATSGRLSTLPSQCTLFSEQLKAKCCADAVAKVANSAPYANTLPRLFAVAAEDVSLDLATYFFDANEEVLKFTVAGLSTSSGFTLVGSVISGVPSDADLAAIQPIVLTFTARDAEGANATNALSVSVAAAGAIVGQYFSVDVFGVFEGTQANGWAFEVIGLPSGSGVSVDSVAGVISGVATQADAFEAQPLQIIVNATNSRGEMRTSRVYILVTAAAATVGVPLSIDTSAHFDAIPSTLGYTLAIATGSGISINPLSGVVFGTPTALDAKGPQPLALNVTATDAKGGVHSLRFFVDVLAGNLQPRALAIPGQVAILNHAFKLDLSRFFTDSNGDALSLSISGLPSSSGLSVTAAGVLQGTPSVADLLVTQPMALVVTASDGNGGVNEAVVSITIAAADAIEGIPVSIDVAPHFSDVTPVLKYTASNLPAGSGFRIDSAAGKIVGIPTQADSWANQPVPITITAYGPDSSVELTLFVAVSVETTSLGKELSIDTFRYFETGSSKYRVAGLSIGSGLQIDSLSGAIYGRPTAIDAAQSQPIAIVVSALLAGKVATARLFVHVTDANMPTAAPISDQLAILGEPFSVALSTSFAVGDQTALYSIAGLPIGTGFSMDKQGILSGTPSLADSKEPLLLVVTAKTRGGAVSETLLLLVAALDGVVGTPLSLDAMPYVEVGDSSTPRTFALSGLPNGTGLSITATGLLHGAPTLADAFAPQPMAIAVTSNSKMASAIIYLAVSAARGTVGVPLRPLDVSAYFVVDAQKNLAYSLSGLPEKSRLYIGIRDGVILGTPSLADVEVGQPMRVTVTAESEAGISESLSLLLLISVGNEPTPQQLSVLSCKELGWPVATATPSVCASSVVLGSCSGKVSYKSAQTFCQLAGSRVCSSDELRADVTVGSGCELSDKRVWTATACQKGQVVTQSGSSSELGSNPPTCTSTASMHPVRCCADAKGEVETATRSGLVATAIPPLSVIAGVLTTRPLAEYFSFDTGSTVVYSLTTPADLSGFTIDPQSGVLTGVARVLEGLTTVPYKLFITATDETEEAAVQPLLLSIAIASAQVGDQVALDVQSAMTPRPPPGSIFSLEEVSKLSGITINNVTGRISGAPNLSDLAELQPMPVRVVATDARGKTYSVSFRLDVTPTSESPMPFAEPLPASVQYAGKLVKFEAGSYFHHPDDLPLVFSLRGLPDGSGLTIDADTGIVSGVPNAADALALQPLDVLVVASDPGGASVQEPWRVTIAATTALVGQQVRVDTSSLFQSMQGNKTYSLGTSYAGSGLRVDAAGSVIGSPTRADLAQPQPLPVNVVASNGRTTQPLTFYLMVYSGANARPVASLIPSAVAVGGVSFKADISASFIDADEQPLTFTSDGLPKGTGFQLNPTTGVITGVPTIADILASQPLSVSFTADDGGGGTATATMLLTVVFAVVDVGKTISNVDVASLLSPAAASRASLSLLGLPAGTGLRLVAGRLAGIANDIDLRASQPLSLVLVATEGEEVRRVEFRVQVLAGDAVTSVTIPGSVGIAGRLFTKDIAPFFTRVSGSALTYTLLGTPTGSGLRIDTNTGIVSGFPTPSDVLAEQPLTLTVVSTNMEGAVTQQVFTLAVAAASVKVGASLSLAAGSALQAPPGSSLAYSLELLPEGSGFFANPNTGFILGTATAVDRQQEQPVPLILIGTDRKTQETYSLKFFLLVEPGDGVAPSPAPGAVPPQTLEPLRVVLGEPFQLDLNDYAFATLTGRLTYAIQGLPEGSRIRVNAEGVLLGPAGVMVARLSQPVDFTVRATNGAGASITQNVRMTVGLAEVSAGSSVYLDISVAFQDARPAFSPTRYELSGLPRGSGLRINPTSGIVSGTATAADVAAAQTKITVSATDGQRMESFPFLLFAMGSSSKIPDQTVAVGDTLTLELALYFPDGAPVAYAVSGLPTSSGFSINDRGEFTGSPAATDVFGTQPIAAVVTATAADGFKSTRPLRLTVIAFETRAHENFSYDLSSYFPAQSLTGLPAGTGFDLDPATGRFFGSPQAVDAEAAQPMSVTVIGTGDQGEELRYSFLVQVVSGNENPVASPIPDVIAVVDEPLSVNVSAHFTDNHTLAFTMTNLPPGSRLSINAATGIVAGVPSQADANVPQPLVLAVVARDPYGGYANASLVIRVALARVMVGRPTELDVSAYFQGYIGKQYSLVSPSYPGTGLYMSADGKISGSPTTLDLQQPQPLLVTVEAFYTATRESAEKEFFVIVTDAANSPPVATPIPVVVAVANEELTLDLAQYFSDVDGDALSFSELRGLPSASNFRLSAAGVLKGTPSEADALLVQPLSLTLQVSDGRGGLLQQPIQMVVALLKVSPGKTLSFAAKDLFSATVLGFALPNLRSGSGFTVDANGVVRGLPSDADLAAEQPTSITVRAQDAQGTAVSKTFRVLLLDHTAVPLSTPIPPTSALVGSALEPIDITKHFVTANGPLKYALVPADIGLSIDTAGQLMGTPTLAAGLLSQPINMTVFATDQLGAATPAPLIITVALAMATPQTALKLATKAAFGADAAAFSVKGLPNGTGFLIDSVTGIMTGRPSAADLAAAQPVIFEVNSQNSVGQVRTARLAIDAASGTNSAPQVLSPPSPEVVVVGRPFSFATSSRFTDSDAGDTIRFGISGLPSTTGISINSTTGVVSGIPQPSDAMRVQPLRALITARDQSNATASTSLDLSVALIVGGVGQKLSLDVSKFFMSTGGRFELRGLPVGSGLEIDAITGVVRGAPTLADLAQPQPLALRVVEAENSQTFHVWVQSEYDNPITLAANPTTNYQAHLNVPVYILLPGLFVHREQHTLSFAIEALAGSGFTINADAGMLEGSPTQIDLDASPVQVRVFAADGMGSIASTVLNITVDELTGTAPVVSNLGCAQLQWDAYGLDGTVCASASVLGECAETATYTAATAFCASIGARLCTSQELTLGVGKAAFASCDFTPSLAWSSSQCGGDSTRIAALSPDPANLSYPPKCLEPTARSNVVCCADTVNSGPTPLPAQPKVRPQLAPQLLVSQLSCTQLGWMPKESTPDVCSSSVVDGSCSPDLQFAQAISFCGSVGARLCSEDELTQDVAAGEGCDLDLDRTWSSTLCDGDEVVTMGGSTLGQGSNPPTCVPSSRFFPVRCCADVNTETRPIPPAIAVAGYPYSLDIARFFMDSYRDTLTYSVEGLPSGSGLTFDRFTGTLSGVPTVDADAVAGQPLQLVITGRGTRSNEAVQTLELKIAAALATEGRAVSIDVSAYLASLAAPAARLRYALIGLPRGSGFSISPVGVILGSPTEADAKLEQPLELTAVATDQMANPVSVAILVLIISGNAPPEATPIAPAKAIAGYPFAVDVSRSFYDPDGDIMTFTLSGLPSQSGLRIDPLTGVISGTPTAADSLKSQPLIVQVVVDDGRGGLAQARMVLTVAAARIAVGQPLALSVREAFLGLASGSTFLVIGTPVGSGISIDRQTGTLIGSATDIDGRQQQPMPLTVQALTSAGTVGQQQTFLLDVVSTATPSLRPYPTGPQSDKSCGELGWKIKVTTPSACSGTPCAPNSTQADAASFCKLQGARLCTSDEVFANVAQGDTCGLDMQRVWTSTPCAEGSISLGGSSTSLAANPITCSPRSESLPAACCADVYETMSGPSTSDPANGGGGMVVVSGRSRLSCQALGWTGTPNRPEVCASSVVNGACSNVMSYPAAAEWCSGVGARVCTSNELAADVASQSGCALNEERVWTATPCDARMGVTQAGASPELVTFPAKCTPLTLQYQVRCCADTEALTDRCASLPCRNGAACTNKKNSYSCECPPGFVGSNCEVQVTDLGLSFSSCDTLGWQIAVGTDVCAQSVIYNKCSRVTNFDQAEYFCATAGARLCSSAELASGVATGTGCRLDDKRVWSGTRCTESTIPSAISQLGGADVAPSRASVECTILDTPLPTRCCADRVPGAPTVPAAPFNPPAVSSTQATTAVVSWEMPPDNGATITMYRVLRQIGGSGPYTQHAAMNVSDFASRIVSTTLTDLTPVTSYRFQVAAVNTHGTGPAGPASAAVTTLAGVPGRVPSLPTVHNIASISLILMWSQPANHGAPILGYRIMVAEGDATEFTEYLSTTDNDIVIHSIIGLLPATRYRFTVAAINAFGTGPASEPSAATTTEIAAPSQPGTPVPSQVGLDSVLLTWDAPARSNGALISGYRIRTQTGSSTRSDVHVLNSGSDATSARVTGLQQYVTYRFQVQAINIVGVGEASEFGLPVTTLSGPGTVAQVAVSDVSASSVVLSWVAPPSRGREILGYRVEGKVDGVAYMTMPTNITFVGNKVVAHVMDLRAFKAYQFAIVAFNDLSGGAPSTAIDVLTAVGVPGVIPGPPTVGKVTATSVVLNWNPPLESNGAAVTGYRVSSQMNGVGEFVEEALNLQGGEYVLATVGNLTANTVYRFKVAAINEAGQGTYSQASEPSTTATDIPGAMPRAPIAMTLNATELTLSWVAPNDHGSPITGYQILRRINGAGAYSVQVNNTKSAATTALVDNLRPNTVYTFKVAAINALGVGELSPETSFSVTSMSAPGSPSLPTVTNVGPASLILMWEPPASNGFPVTAYQIFARIGNASEFIELLRSPTDAIVLTVEGLLAHTRYSFRVAGINVKGVGQASDASANIVTASDVPSQVPLVSAVAAGPRAADLSWGVPGDNGARITGFLVRAKESEDDTFRLVASTDVVFTGDTKNTATVMKLREGGVYVFRVAAVNSIGTGAESASSTPVRLPRATGGDPELRDLDLAEVSRLTCSELDWAVHEKTPLVCGASMLFGVACPPIKLDYWAAQSFCAAAGSRLCTSTELEADVTLGTGCGLDTERVWSSSSCTGSTGFGYTSTAGSTMGRAQNPPQCTSPSTQLKPRCCADDLQVSAKSCELLGWRVQAGATACANSKILGTICSAFVSAPEANEFCQAAGARLCNADELAADLAYGTGCGLDLERVWSATQCANGATVSRAGSVAAEDLVKAKCSAKAEMYKARCCADTQAIISREKKGLCGVQSLCRNGATCVDGFDGYTCLCPPGFTGEQCEQDIDECAASPCGVHGACTNGIAVYTCKCEPGYTGTDCEVKVVYCAPGTCMHNGTCTEGVSDFTCACPITHSGKRCEQRVDICSIAPCINGGTCVETESGFACQCTPGYEGSNCHINVDDCASRPCINGGICIDGVEMYTCQCPVGFLGDSCEMVDPTATPMVPRTPPTAPVAIACETSPCKNGSGCSVVGGKYVCACRSGWAGNTCSVELTVASLGQEILDSIPEGEVRSFQFRAFDNSADAILLVTTKLSSPDLYLSPSRSDQLALPTPTDFDFQLMAPAGGPESAFTLRAPIFSDSLLRSDSMPSLVLTAVGMSAQDTFLGLRMIQSRDLVVDPALGLGSLQVEGTVPTRGYQYYQLHPVESKEALLEIRQLSGQVRVYTDYANVAPDRDNRNGPAVVVFDGYASLVIPALAGPSTSIMARRSGASVPLQPTRGLLGLAINVEPDYTDDSARNLYVSVYGVEAATFSIKVSYADCGEPCLNGGVCKFAAGGSQCSCPVGFGGRDCAQVVSPAVPTQRPIPGAEPTPSVLPPPTSPAVVRTCEPSPCENGSSCSIVMGQAQCACRKAWGGKDWAGMFCDVELIDTTLGLYLVESIPDGEKLAFQFRIPDKSADAVLLVTTKLNSPGLYLSPSRSDQLALPTPTDFDFQLMAPAGGPESAFTLRAPIFSDSLLRSDAELSLVLTAVGTSAQDTFLGLRMIQSRNMVLNDEETTLTVEGEVDAGDYKYYQVHPMEGRETRLTITQQSGLVKVYTDRVNVAPDRDNHNGPTAQMFANRATLILPEIAENMGPVDGRRLLQSQTFLEPDAAVEGSRSLYAGVYGVDLSSYSVTVSYATCPAPCLNGGICRFLGLDVSGSQCDCSGLAFTGASCTETEGAGVTFVPLPTPAPSSFWDIIGVGGWVGVFVAIALFLACVCAFVICRLLKQSDERAKKYLDNQIDDLMEDDVRFADGEDLVSDTFDDHQITIGESAPSSTHASPVKQRFASSSADPSPVKQINSAVSVGAPQEERAALLVDDIIIRPEGEGERRRHKKEKGSKRDKKDSGGYVSSVLERKPKSVRVRAPDILAGMDRGRPPFVGLSDEQLARLAADNAHFEDYDEDQEDVATGRERGGLLRISYPLEGEEAEKYTRRAKR